MTLKKLSWLLVAAFMVTVLATAAVLWSDSLFAGTAADDARGGTPGQQVIGNVEYLYTTGEELVLMHGSDVVTRVSRVFDPLDTDRRNTVVWTHDGNYVALLSDTHYRGKDSESTELISIHTATGTQQRIPCPRCRDIVAFDHGSVLVTGTLAKGWKADVTFKVDLATGGPVTPFNLAAPADWGPSPSLRYFVASGHGQVITGEDMGAANWHRVHLVLHQPAATEWSKTWIELGRLDSNNQIRAAVARPSDPRIAIATSNYADCGKTPMSYLIDPMQYGVRRTDISAAYPPGSAPGKTSGAAVHDLWWSKNGELRATISSWLCGPKKDLETPRTLFSPPSVWQLNNMKWERTDLGPATMVREIAHDTKVILDATHCLEETRLHEQCGLGKLTLDSKGERTAIAEGVISIASRPA
ncbi:hypothetical protein ACXIZN_41145 [Amycolatopsis sp. TRM77291]